MPKISDCDALRAGFAHRCFLYAHNPHLVCAVHPNGVDSDRCLDFRLDPNIKEDKQWSPQGYSWYGDELISNRPSRYSQEEQIEILDNHPFFTGVCPQCRHEFDLNNRPVHFDCSSCGWVDDSESAIALAIYELSMYHRNDKKDYLD